MATIVVTGATGTLGRPVAEQLRGQGHQVRPASRHPARDHTPPVDLRTGTGLAQVLEGADTLVHCATSPTGGDITATRHLIAAARAAGVQHLVHISIVGCDRVPLGYYKTKHLVEQALLASDLGVSVLRTTQFHDLVRLLVRSSARLPVMAVPDIPVQPIGTAEVAARLAHLAVQEPQGRVTDMAGPSIQPLAELAHTYLDSVGSHRRPVPVRLPGATMAAFGRGEHLAPDRKVGTQTFADFCALGSDGYQGRWWPLSSPRV
ncbi:SDR family oxidoreductase [Nocardiopsis kunsanensis]|uniref:SDR family oxidoreductase n=1 Tax=Nocardiopsis kunsanensis TaxID=141693 RepID=UPI00034B1307|nr:SDR family oxidoreductase [Nocardiopsis kunsanensis]